MHLLTNVVHSKLNIGTSQSQILKLSSEASEVGGMREQL